MPPCTVVACLLPTCRLHLYPHTAALSSLSTCAECCMASCMSSPMIGRTHSKITTDRATHHLLPMWLWMRLLKLAASLLSSFPQLAATFISLRRSQTALCWTYWRRHIHHKEVGSFAVIGWLVWLCACVTNSMIDHYGAPGSVTAGHTKIRQSGLAGCSDGCWARTSCSCMLQIML